jgi:hypothetical protein
VQLFRGFFCYGLGFKVLELRLKMMVLACRVFVVKVKVVVQGFKI